MGTWSYFFSSTIISIWLCLSFWVKSHGVVWDVAFCQSVGASRHEPCIAAARAHGKVPGGSKQQAEQKCSFNPLCYPWGLPGFIKCILVSVMMIWYVNDLCTSGNNSERILKKYWNRNQGQDTCLSLKEQCHCLLSNYSTGVWKWRDKTNLLHSS